MSTSTKDESSSKPFPAKAKVILHGLKAADFNGKVGIVQSSSLNEEGRQQVLVEELGKTVALKVANLQYQERPLDSLSNKELKNILRYKKDVLKFQGMDKADLQAQLKDLSTDPMEIAEWLAHANSSGNSSSSAADSSSTSATADSSNADPDIQDGLSQFDQMTPEQLRQQAMMMKSMPPATLRQMNPQLAHMSDAQIVQAAQQMEMMASNPQMMQMARNQMKNMTPAQKAQYKQMMASQPQAKAGTPAAAGGNPLENMTPEQMRQQAQMMKSMPPDTLRQMNPQLAHMSDAQIAQAAQQMEMMASNPELVKMATEQMKNMSPEQMQAMMRQQAAGGGGGANSMNPMMMGGAGGGNNNGDMSFDPAKMLETMDTAQIKQMMQGLKSYVLYFAQVILVYFLGGGIIPPLRPSSRLFIILCRLFYYIFYPDVSNIICLNAYQKKSRIVATVGRSNRHAQGRTRKDDCHVFGHVR